ncbi:MAG: hypothetical protein FJY65_11395, partial [Calditrichaeota bacterium]|nr:hypothetical protein [Calditrichota bacterium]
MNCLHIILAPAAGLIAGLTTPTLLAAAGQNAASPVNIQITVTERNSLAISLDIAEFNCEQVSADGERLTRISLDQEASTRQAGMPELPVVTRVVMLPPRGGVRVIIDDIETHIEKSVPIDADGDADGELGRGLREVGEDGFWPASPVVVGTPAILRGVRLAAVNCYPVQYNAITKQTRFIDRINFRLVFEGEGENEVENPDRLPLSSYAAKILDELVLNPPPQRDDVMSGVYLYIVPQFNGVDTTLAPLINWRMRQGHKVSVARVVNDAPSATILAVIRQAYEADPPVEFVTLVGDAGGIENSLRLPAATNTGDYQYTRLDGNDPLPDIALGRLSAHTLQELALIVNKIVSYESNPMMGNTNWFRQGLVVAGARINGKSEILTAKYARRNLLELGWREVRNWYWDERGDIGGNEQVNFLNDNFNWGISVLFYRAYQRMNGLSNDAITNLPNRDGRWPFVITISCDTGDFTGNSDGQSEAFLRARGGGIAAIGTATPMTNVMFNNIVAGGTFKGVYIMGLHNPGWGLNWGKYELWRAYDGLDPNYSGFMDWNNLMGDPGTRLWTGVPLEISVEHPQNLALGQTYFPVLVRDRQTNEPLAQAQVCLWKSGELHSVMKTDASGAARFFIEAEALTAGSLLVTVTKHNVRPYLGSATVARNDRFLGLTEWTIADNIRGNGNWTLNPNEDFDIQLNVRNSGGQRIDGRLAATLLSHSEWVEISADTLEIENAPEVGQSLRLEFNGRTSPLCPDLTEHNLELIIWNDNERWVSSASPVSAAPVLEVIGVNGVLVPGEVRDINIRLHNRGRQALPAFRVRLESQSDAVSVERGEVNFPALAVDGDAYGSQPFRLSTRPFVLPGQPARLSLTTEVNNVPLAAATTLHIGAPGDGDPFGPDEYGYYCFDSGDRGYEIAPVYRWIEIDPNIEPHDFEGMDMRIRDTGDNRDSSAVVQLPFDFQYYGQTFRQLTVCTNGWAAFGDQAELSDFRNTHIGQALGPVAQLCVWWDNLMTTNESRILTFHDRETGRFIVEWSRMRRLLTQGQGALETFQLILYDPAVRPTFTGDGIIDFQYRDVTNEDRTARNDVPYCTIGISNLDDSGGLEYTYWNRYTTGAMPIQPLMTIRWTTASQLISGVIKGAVRDLATGEPVEGAVVTVSRGYRTQTDRQGGYLLDVLVGENYFVTAGGIGWNDTTRTGFNV